MFLKFLKIQDVVDLLSEIVCKITSFLELSQQPVTSNIYNTYIPYPLNTVVTVVVRKNMKILFLLV